MKKSTLKQLFAALGLIAVSAMMLNSCKDDSSNPTPKPTQNMLQVLSQAKYSIFKSALDKAQLSSTFSGSTQYTIFAPTDDVMVAAGITNVDGFTEAELANLIRYHMVEGEKTAANLPEYGYITTLNNEGPAGLKLKLNITVTGGVIGVNSFQVISTTMATNGVVHEINTVLKQPTLYDMITNSADLAKYKTGLDFETNIKDLFKNPSGLTTVFVVNNEGTTAYINAKNRQFSSMAPADRRAFLNNGIVANNNKLAAGLSSGSLTTLGDPLNVSMSGGQIMLNDSVSVLITDIQCVNGVIHVVNKALAK